MDTTPSGSDPAVPDVSAVRGVLGADLAGALARWAGDARVDADAAERTRAHWRRVADEGDASFAGTLARLAERATTASLHVGDQRLVGQIVGLGVDFVALRTPAADALVVRTDAIDAVVGETADRRVVGAGSGTHVDVTLASILGPIAADRPEAIVRTPSVAVRGVLRSAGRDVVTLWRDGDRREPVWVPIARISTLTLV